MSNEDNKKAPKKKSSANDEFPLQEYRLLPVNQIRDEKSGEEIDLIELAKTLWGNRTTLLKFIAVAFVVGIVVVLLSPKEYKAYATLMPEYSTEGGGGASSFLKQYGGLIGLSGGSYNSNSNAIRVDLYPEIVKSLTFQKKLADQEFYYVEYDTSGSLETYFNEIKEPGFGELILGYTIGLPGKIIGAIFSSDESKTSVTNKEETLILNLSRKEIEFIGQLRSRTAVSLNDESGIISVSARMPNPELAAEVAQFTIEELTSYLTEYRIEKVQRDLGFIKEQLDKAERRFTSAHLALAEFVDSNQGSLSARARIEEQNLNSEYNLASNLYNSLTQQYEEAQIKVQEETPMFKVLQPVQVPVNDEQSGASVLFVFLILGGITGVAWVFIKQLIFNKN